MLKGFPMWWNKLFYFYFVEKQKAVSTNKVKICICIQKSSLFKSELSPYHHSFFIDPKKILVSFQWGLSRKHQAVTNIYKYVFPKEKRSELLLN